MKNIKLVIFTISWLFVVLSVANVYAQTTNLSSEYQVLSFTPGMPSSSSNTSNLLDDAFAELPNISFQDGSSLEFIASQLLLPSPNNPMKDYFPYEVPSGTVFEQSVVLVTLDVLKARQYINKQGLPRITNLLVFLQKYFQMKKIRVKSVTELASNAKKATFRIELYSNRDINGLMKLILADAFGSATPNYGATTSCLPNDPLISQGSPACSYSEQLLPGLTPAITDMFGFESMKVENSGAWDVSNARASVVVAVLDVGVDPTHPDLVNAININIGELPASLDVDLNGYITSAELLAVTTDQDGDTVVTILDALIQFSNGIDDDGNGYMDDIAGWDVVDGDNNPFDGSSLFHGTHVAGLIAAEDGNMIHIAGIAPGDLNVAGRILPIRAVDNNNVMFTTAAVDGLNYAHARAVDFPFLSANLTSSNLLESALAPFSPLTIVPVGNNGVNIYDPLTSGGLGETTIASSWHTIAATAVDNFTFALSPMSNFGIATDVMAPITVNVPLMGSLGTLSTVPLAEGALSAFQGVDYMSGTSVAAAEAAGVVALMINEIKSNPNTALLPTWVNPQTKRLLVKYFLQASSISKGGNNAYYFSGARHGFGMLNPTGAKQIMSNYITSTALNAPKIELKAVYFDAQYDVNNPAIINYSAGFNNYFPAVPAGPSFGVGMEIFINWMHPTLGLQHDLIGSTFSIMPVELCVGHFTLNTVAAGITGPIVNMEFIINSQSPAFGLFQYNPNELTETNNTMVAIP